MMKARYYTLAEARAVLPRVKQLMEMAQQARREIRALRPQAWPALRDAAANGGNRAAGDMLVQFEQLEAGVKGIMAMGIQVKDVDQGIIDFVGTRNSREIFLCWRYGEPDIAYWHEISAGFAGRQPIDDAVD